MKTNYTILAIDTSCDETSAAITVDDRIMSNVISSQVALHKKYGGVVPILAQRAHKERIGFVVEEALVRYEVQRLKDTKTQNKFKAQSLKKNNRDYLSDLRYIDAVAVTIGPGLAPALEVGIAKAKELAKQFNKPLIAVNHMEGHLLSSFAKNSKGRESRSMNHESRKKFPLLGLLISGGHTELVLMEDFGKYKLVGETLDDAVGEAYDKIAKILNLGYPGGPIVERLAKSGNRKTYPLPIPMKDRKDLNFSFSGLKTAVLYLVQKLKEKNGNLSKQVICDICASFQYSATQSLIDKLLLAIDQYESKAILLGGGVISNLYIRSEIRKAVNGIPVFIPYSKKLFTDNAGMIGVSAYFQARRNDFVKDIEKVDRLPGLNFS